ncbi:glycosyltransferase family 2 protein [Gordonia westfalica]|uniref:4,4'-diaponeurosporenoate glycosyltransferase n=1 Tax=Gordonia westfalica TaxID=158898 RepID=A0ABU2GQY9_9ACTN|nr:glycosyltransferase family 2 protein [Gordonia westfalica]MDS1113881.1 glycosyltransferase family 2 protein [Gordonia westfalica]
MKLSVVVPAHNEERELAACLDHLLAQSLPIDEIIVVDNDSNDRTGEVAGEYARRFATVRLLTEKRRGVARARDRGFDSATGDVIGRVDADARARRDWSSVVMRFFTDESNAQWDVIGGFPLMTDAPGWREHEKKLRKWAADRGGRETGAVIGQCFAIRRTCWEAIRGDLLSDRRDIHEDHDMSAAVRQAGGRLWLSYRLIVEGSSRRYRVPPWRNVGYALGGPRAAWARGDRKLFAKQAFVVLPLSYAYLWVIWVRLRGWDPETERWSLSRFREGAGEDIRNSPFVD